VNETVTVVGEAGFTPVLSMRPLKPGTPLVGSHLFGHAEQFVCCLDRRAVARLAEFVQDPLSRMLVSSFVRSSRVAAL